MVPCWEPKKLNLIYFNNLRWFCWIKIQIKDFNKLLDVFYLSHEFHFINFIDIQFCIIFLSSRLDLFRETC